MKKKCHPCVMCCHMESKLKNPEQYYITLLQLYMPWRDEDNLKGTYHTFQKKYLDVESIMKPNILTHNKYFETFDIDDDILGNHYDYSSFNDNTKMSLAWLTLIYLTTIAEMNIMELMMNQLDLLLLLQFLMLLYLFTLRSFL